MPRLIIYLTMLTFNTNILLAHTININFYRNKIALTTKVDKTEIIKSSVVELSCKMLERYLHHF